MKSIALLALIFLFPLLSYSQEEGPDNVYRYGRRYLDVNIKAEELYTKRISKQQSKLLQRIARKEHRYVKRLKNRDSASYVKYCQNELTYDSIAHLKKSDNPTASKSKAGLRKSNGSIDSLKKINSFIEEKAHVTGEKSSKNGKYPERLDRLNAEQSKQANIQQLIDQRTAHLQSLSKGNRSLKGFIKIQKEVYYSKGKMSAFKQLKNDPSKAEQKALEYLQGTEGFNECFNSDANLSNSNSLSLKKQMDAAFQEKFGGNISGVQKNMSSQIKQFDKYAKPINNAKASVNRAKNIKTTYRNPIKLEKEKLGFMPNSMRCLPFKMRLEKELNYQTIRANAATGEPARFAISATLGYKHTPNWVIGGGLSQMTGLGQNWNNVKFSFEGLGVKTYTRVDWRFGFGIYGSYERLYKRTAFSKPNDNGPTQTESLHNRSTYSEAVLMGITKSYHLTSKWNGQIQLLYDIWWKDKGLTNPFQLRFATLKSNN